MSLVNRLFRSTSARLTFMLVAFSFVPLTALTLWVSAEASKIQATSTAESMVRLLSAREAHLAAFLERHQSIADEVADQLDAAAPEAASATFAAAATPHARPPREDTGRSRWAAPLQLRIDWVRDGRVEASTDPARIGAVAVRMPARPEVHDVDGVSTLSFSAPSQHGEVRVHVDARALAPIVDPASSEVATSGAHPDQTLDIFLIDLDNERISPSRGGALPPHATAAPVPWERGRAAAAAGRCDGPPTPTDFGFDVACGATAAFYTTPDGRSVLGAARPLVDAPWILVAEQDRAEIDAPISRLRVRTGIATLFGSVALALLAFFGVRQIALPLQGLASAAHEVGSGNLALTVPYTHRTDEIGEFARSFDAMVQALRTQTMELSTAIGLIHQSAGQITATITQLAESTSQSAATTSQATATVMEVKQTAFQSSEKANLVAEAAGIASAVAQSGRQSTEDTVEGMRRIDEQMSYIAETMVKLSDQTQAIGEIMATVNDLADQSNVLAVNAAIEAARAGEHGRGFAVVAREVRDLAEQSKQATARVRGLLHDISKATAAASHATEQGAKVVSQGGEHAIAAGDAIRTLSSTVEDAATAAAQIASSTHQQLTGMSQVAEAMEAIKRNALDNATCAKQLEPAGLNLDALGRSLLALVEKYRV